MVEIDTRNRQEVPVSAQDQRVGAMLWSETWCTQPLQMREEHGHDAGGQGVGDHGWECSPRVFLRAAEFQEIRDDLGPAIPAMEAGMT